MFTIIKSTELTLYTQSGLFEEGLKLIPEIEEGLYKYEDHISSVRKAHFFFNIAVIYFGLEKYHEALKWINQLLNNVEIDKSRDIHCMAQILNMVIHLELGNKSLLPFALRSTQRFLETRKKVYRFETIMLQFINEVLKKREKPGMNLYKELVESLKELKSDAFERRVYEYFDFVAWASSKINMTIFRDEIGK
jgi:tetratricopeptide (TPR) repeat protein